MSTSAEDVAAFRAGFSHIISCLAPLRTSVKDRLGPKCVEEERERERDMYPEGRSTAKGRTALYQIRLSGYLSDLEV